MSEIEMPMEKEGTEGSAPSESQNDSGIGMNCETDPNVDCSFDIPDGYIKPEHLKSESEAKENEEVVEEPLVQHQKVEEVQATEADSDSPTQSSLNLEIPEKEEGSDIVIKSPSPDISTVQVESQLRRMTSCMSVDPDSEDFFEKFSSIRIQYEDNERKTIKEFQFTPEDVPDGTVADQLWPTLGGWNVDDLYSEVLYALIHTLKTPEADTLVRHLQQVFHIDNDKHQKLLEAARDKKAPPLVLNLEVIEAKGLKGKDVNGLSDPFCTLYVSPKQKHNTSMKPATLNPSWKEYFSFPITNLQDDILSIEVWDYDPEETVAEKMRRFSEIKSTRGLRILMKEIALTASTGKTTHEFLGCLKIPIKNIPAEGFDNWFNLESRNGNGHKKKGEIHLRMAMGAEKDKKVAAQEYRHVLHLLLVYELDEQEVQPYAWDGQFSKNSSEYILRQLRWQGGLLPQDIELAKWLVYTRVQCEHPLNTKLFPPIFAAVIDHYKKEAISDDDIRKFWFASEKLVDNFCGFVRNIHHTLLNNSNVTSQAYHMLRTLGSIKSHFETSKTRPNKRELEGKLSSEFIIQKTENAISRGAEDVFTSIIRSDSNTNETEVENMIKTGQLLIADLRMGLEMLDSVFRELLGIDYFDITYRVYDEKYCELVEPLVEKISSSLKPLDLRDENFCQEQDVSIGTTLFELYLAVKQFADLSSNLPNRENLSIQGSFHNWFHSSVAQWLDIAWYKALQRIQKAVELDTLRPLDEYVQFSSSAVDTAHIFHQIQIFWNQLSWPEVEGSYAFIAKILDDLCKCIIYYAEITCRKVEELESKQDNDKYEISNELCLAINNIEYVGREMKPISEKLEMDKIIEQLGEKNGASIADQCRRTLTTVMDNAIENINVKVYEILDKVGSKLKPIIYRFLLDGAETGIEDDGVEKLIKYLDKNLIKLQNKMTSSGFDKIFLIIWEKASVALRELIRTNIDKRRPPSFFKNIHNMLQILLNYFYPNGLDDSTDSSIQEINDLLSLHGASTTELILKFQQDRYRHQSQVKSKTGERGMITLRALYCEDIQQLRIEVLNCRNLKPTDSNGQCDPFVKIQLVPQDIYPVPPKKTKVKKKTLFPLFDETFSIPLTPEEMSFGGLIFMSVKDKDLFGRNDFIGEIFLPLESIPFTTSDKKLQDLPQLTLPLTLPSDDMSNLLQTLENRHWDKVACEFAKKQRLRQNGGHQNNHIGGGGHNSS